MKVMEAMLHLYEPSPCYAHAEGKFKELGLSNYASWQVVSYLN